jgi:hypothetical protein
VRHRRPMRPRLAVRDHHAHLCGLPRRFGLPHGDELRSRLSLLRTVVRGVPVVRRRVRPAAKHVRAVRDVRRLRGAAPLRHPALVLARHLRRVREQLGLYGDASLLRQPGSLRPVHAIVAVPRQHPLRDDRRALRDGPTVSGGQRGF